MKTIQSPYGLVYVIVFNCALKESTVSICNKVRKSNKVWNNTYNKGCEIHQLKLTSVSVHLWLLVLGSIPDVQLQNDVILSCFLFFLHQR